MTTFGNPDTLEKACYNFGWAWGGAEMFDAIKLLENLKGPPEENLVMAVTLVEGDETNAVNKYLSRHGRVGITDMVLYFSQYIRSLEKELPLREIFGLSVVESISFAKEQIQGLNKIILDRARKGNAFYKNFLATNSPELYIFLENERQERDKRYAKISDSDLPF